MPDFKTPTKQVRNIPVVTALFVLMLIYVGRVQELFPFMEKLYVGKVTMLCCLILFFNTAHTTPWREVNDLPQMKYIKLLLLWCFLSMPFSTWPALCWGYTTEVLFKTGVLFVLVILSIRCRPDLTLLVWGLVCSALLLSTKTLLLPKVERMSVSTSLKPEMREMMS